MKTNLTIILLFILCSTAGFAQQYSWVDISSNVPDFINDTVIANGGQDTVIAGYADVFFLNNNEGWICTNHGVTTDSASILYTKDGGQTFTTQTTQFQCYAIHMINSQTGYACGWNGRVYKTTNGGSYWKVHGSVGGPLRDIDFPPNSETGYCCGDQGKIYKITSTGITSVSSGVTAHLRSISFPSSGLGWTCSNGIIRHFDGVTWYEQDSPLSSYNGIYMINNTTGWAVGDFGVIVNTTDGGLSWKYQANPDKSNRNLNDVYFLNVNEGWAVGNSGIILHTANGGKLWTIEGAGLTTNMLRAVQFTSSTNGYVLGNKGTLLKFGILTAIEELPTHLSGFTLEQNYPNPFNETTTIDFILTAPSQVVLEVFSIGGEKICTLANEKKFPGKYSVPFHAKDFPAGIYYYRLQTETGTTARKMTLIK